MKFAQSVLVPLALFAFGAGAAAPTEQAPKTEAQKEYAAFNRLASEEPPKELTPTERSLWYSIHFFKVCDAADRFIRRFPQDPLRWSAAEIHTVYAANLEQAVGGLRTRADELIAQALESKDISDPDWQRAKSRQISRLMRKAHNPADPDKPVDLLPLRRALDELTQRFPESDMLPTPEVQYTDLLKQQNPALSRAWLEHLSRGANQELAKLASGQLNIIKLREAPAILKFTALDGREVDLASLRGKVVLIDFWATWCGPCVAELPNIKALYDEYHAKGFEVVGISLDRREDEKKLRDFIAARKLPWPQYFDGKDRNAIAEEFGIFRIPTQLLLDREGRLVNDQARGEVLKTEIARLFGS